MRSRLEHVVRTVPTVVVGRHGHSDVYDTVSDDDFNGTDRLLQSVPGIGPVVATATIAAVGNGADFEKGRGFAAWLGLVPRQYSTGGKQKLLSISKRGKVLRSGSVAELSFKHEVLFSALHCEHVGNHLPGYGKRRPVLVRYGVLSLSLSGIGQSRNWVIE